MTRGLRAGALLALLLAAGCGDGSQGEAREVVAHWSLEPARPAEGPLEVRLALSDDQGRPLEGAKVELEGNMTHPGMVPERAVAREVEPGSYVGAIELTMGGDWFLLAEITLRDGARVTKQLDLPGVKAR